MTTMTISKELLDELLSGVKRPEDLLGDKVLMKELKVRLMERMLGAELTEHLGYEPHCEPDSEQTNRRNGASRKVLKGNDGAVPIDIPRDRDGSFEPELIQKGQTRVDGMDDKIIGLYAAGLSTRDIRAHLEEVYGLKVSADLISRVTDAVLEEVSDWQNRVLEPVYPIVFLDALRVKIRDAPSRDIAAQYPAGQWKVVRSKTRRFTWPWASPPKASVRFWACGLRPTKGPNSGFRL
jgi:putative transposase